MQTSMSSIGVVAIPSPAEVKSECAQGTATVSERGMSDFEARFFIASSYLFSWALLGTLVWTAAYVQRWRRLRRHRSQ
jgi:hypothetical protein